MQQICNEAAIEPIPHAALGAAVLNPKLLLRCTRTTHQAPRRRRSGARHRALATPSSCASLSGALATPSERRSGGKWMQGVGGSGGGGAIYPRHVSLREKCRAKQREEIRKRSIVHSLHRPEERRHHDTLRSGAGLTMSTSARFVLCQHRRPISPSQQGFRLLERGGRSAASDEPALFYRLLRLCFSWTHRGIFGVHRKM